MRQILEIASENKRVMDRVGISLLAIVGLLFGLISFKSHTSVAAPPADKSTAAADIARPNVTTTASPANQ